MQPVVERVLITHASIAQRVRELAAEVAADLPAAPEAEVTIVPVLTGAMIFCADLIRHLPMRMKIGLLTVSSYPGAATASQGSVLQSETGVCAGRAGTSHIKGRHVILIDDILDSGGTVRLVREVVQRQEPASLKVCVLLRKQTEGARRTPVDYVGFDIPDEFVVGYGLDYDDYYRNLPDIVTLGKVNDER